MSQQKVIAILYLENNLMTGAFNIDRLEMIQMLASQVCVVVMES